MKVSEREREKIEKRNERIVLSFSFHFVFDSNFLFFHMKLKEVKNKC